MDLQEKNKKLSDSSPQEILSWAFEEFKDKLFFASSFGAEDVAIIDMISKINPNALIITLDTGRLPEETYEIMERIRQKYNLKMISFFPSHKALKELVNKKGFYSFRNSLSDRKECCRIRKIEPLKRALSRVDAWITGLRKEQSATRKDIQILVEDDLVPGKIKINPLLNWTEEKVWEYIRQNNVPYNRLHDKNYPSIGCAPCTREIKQGETIRAGRWWWENPEQKECGLHACNNGHKK